MGKNAIVCSLCLLSFLAPLLANDEVMFVDEFYGSQLTQNVLYGSGSTGNPSSDNMDLYLDLYTKIYNEDWSQRLAYFSSIESDFINKKDNLFRFHSGL